MELDKQELVRQLIKKSKDEQNTRLDLSNLDLVEFPIEITELTHLKSLYLGGNCIKTLPDEILNLHNLERLSLSGNRFEAFPMIVLNLPKLKKLSIRGNDLRTVPAEIDRLKYLENLDLSKNKIKSIPYQLGNLKKLEKLDLRENLLEIPMEILNKYKQAQEILTFLLPGSGIKMRPLNEVKLVIVGQGGVGKTSIIERITHDTFNERQRKTEGISIAQWWVNSQIRLNIWDFGGQEIMHTTHQFFLTKRSIYLLVLDSRLTQEENRVEYWLKIIQSYSGKSPVLIVGNKADQHPLDIDRTGLKKKYPEIVDILETSAANGTGIALLKVAIEKQVNDLPHIHDLLPETWFTVKTKLEKIGHEQNFVTHDRYLEICTENEITDEINQHTLISFLHDLGVILHFQDDPRLEALGILNPQWVTNGVYRILNSNTLFQNKGMLELSMLDDILNFPEYPPNKRLFIIDMMRKFEICYDIDPDKNFLVPDLLPKDEPSDLIFTGISAFEYKYPVLPSSVITRFIVRMNQKIEGGFVWRTGVLLKIGENNALVKADYEDRIITIAIDGLEHTRRDTLSAIRYELDEIHNSIEGLNPQKRIPIPEAPNAEPLDYTYLLQIEHDNDLEYLPVKDGNGLVKVNISQLLSGVESEFKRKDSFEKMTNIYINGNISNSNIISGDKNEIEKQSDRIQNGGISMSDLNTLALQIVQFLTPFIPDLIKGGIEVGKSAAGKIGDLVTEKSWDKVQSIWGKLGKHENIKNAAETVDKLPNDNDALAALRLQIKLVLAANDDLAKTLENIMVDHGENRTVTAPGDRSVAIGGNANGNVIITGDNNKEENKNRSECP